MITTFVTKDVKKKKKINFLKSIFSSNVEFHIFLENAEKLFEFGFFNSGFYN